MEIRYTKDVDPNKLNGHRATYEAMKQAAPLAFQSAYDLAKFHGTPLAGWYNERVIYLDPRKYSIEELRSGAWKNDPTIYDKPACLTEQ